MITRRGRSALLYADDKREPNLASDTALLRGIPRLRPIKLIAAGAFGRVWLAQHEVLGRNVAVKLLDRPMVGTSASQFASECRALGAVSDHPNVVTVHEGAVDERLRRGWIMMQYVAGGTLADRVRQQGPLGWRAATAIGVQLAGALASAHLAGVIHRDIKPENVLIGPAGEPLLADFGVAWSISSADDIGVAGTRAYMAPEVLNGAAPVASADVYALAALLYTLLTGDPPSAVTDDAADQAHALRDDVAPVAVREVIARALRRDAQARTSSAIELATALVDARRELGETPVEPVVTRTGSEVTFQTYSSARPDDYLDMATTRRSFVLRIAAARRRAVIATLGIAGVVGGGIAWWVSASGAAPRLQIDGPERVRAGAVATFSASGVDLVSGEWDETCSPPEDAPWRPDSDYSGTWYEPGQCTISLVGRLADGAEHRASKQFEVVFEGEPSATIQGPDQVTAGETVDFTVDVNRIVNGRWSESCIEPGRPDWTPGHVYRGTWDDPGSCTLTLVATTDSGTSITATKAFEVVYPPLSVTIVGPTQVKAGDRVSWSTSASVGAVAGVWAETCVGPTNANWLPGNGYAETFAQVGTCELSLTVYNAENESYTDSHTFEVVA